MIISTMNDLPGYRIDEVMGEVFGLTVRSRNVGSQIGATLKSLVGGELRGMTKMLAEGRDHATDRLVEAAEAKGANAVIAFRFDTSELGTTWTEICAYGVSPADALAYGIILQAVEIATAFVMGAPALLKEGLSWRDVRLRAMHTSPVELPPLPAGSRGEARAEA